VGQADLIQTNFTSGELSPLMKGRVDVTRYFNGVQTLENFIVRPQGGADRRTGSIFINETKDSSKASRLQEFEFSTVQTYILEFGHLYIRVYKDGGIVESAPTVPVEIVSPWGEFAVTDLYFAQSADVLYICHPVFQPRKLSRTSHTDWTLSLLEQEDGPYLDYDENDVTLTVESIVDRMTITSSLAEFVAGDVGDILEYKLDGERTIGQVKTFVSTTEITIEPFDNVIAAFEKEVTLEEKDGSTITASHAVFHRGNVGSYVKLVGDDASLDDTWRRITGYDGQDRDQVEVGSALTMVDTDPTYGNLTHKNRVVTATILASSAIFTSDDVGRHLRLTFDTEQIWADITAFTNTTEVDVTLSRNLPLKTNDSSEYLNDGMTQQWRFGAWSETTGWPSIVTFHEERLVFANTPVNKPQTIWMSQAANYESFAPSEEDSTVVDSNAVTYTIASNKVNYVQWMNSGPVLLIGTIGSEWLAKASTVNEPITPTNLNIRQQSTHGATFIKPERVASAVLFLQRSKNLLRELVYDFEIDSYIAHDLNIVSEHILRDGQGATDMAYQQTPNSILWITRADGQLVGVTYVKEQEVVAWHRHILGGSFGASNAVVESIAAVPASDDAAHVLYMIVKRTINGVTKRYVEYLSPSFDPLASTDKDDMRYMDSLLSYDGVAVSTLTGLDHLEGETVSIVGDQTILPDAVVSGGSITLANPISKAHVGLAYTSLLKTMPPEGGGNAGTAQGKIKRISHVTFRLLNSIGFSYGVDSSDLTLHSMRSSDDDMDVSPDLFTGDIRIELDQDYERDGSYFVAQDQAYPLTIIALMPELVAH